MKSLKTLLFVVAIGCCITAQSATITGTNLTTLTTLPDLGSNVRNNNQRQVYADNAFGTFLTIDEGGSPASWPLFGPTNIGAGGAATGTPGYTAWTPVAQSTSGSGTELDPWKIVTTARAGNSGFTITQTDSLVDPNEFYRTELTVNNTGSDDKIITLYRAMDCYLGSNDSGFGMLAGNTVGCIRRDTASLPNNSSDPTQPISRVEQFLDLSGTAKKEVNGYNSIWSVIGTRSEFADQCIPNCDAYRDNGMGMSWRVTIPAGTSKTFVHSTLFSPTGKFPITTQAAASPSSTLPGNTVSYTITLTNPNFSPVSVETVSFTLPAGFSFIPGSSASDFPQPSVNGNTVTWTGSSMVPAGDGTITITFNSSVGANVMPNIYTSDVSGTANGYTVIPANDTAAVVVTANSAVPTPVPTNNHLILLIGAIGLYVAATLTHRSRKMRA